MFTVLPTGESYVTTDVIIISDKEVPSFTPTPYYIILPNVTSTAKIRITVNEFICFFL